MTMKTFKLLLMWFTVTHGFSRYLPTGHQHLARSSTALYKSISEQDATYLLAKAQECAFSDSATVEDAKHYLRELLHIQSGCVVGTIAGRDLCDNQESVAEIVLRLQAVIDAAPQTTSAPQPQQLGAPETPATVH